MAFDTTAWLEKLLKEKASDGTPRYSPQQLQDVVALVLFSGGHPMEDLSENLAMIMGSFALRSGLNDAKPEQFKEVLEKYFAAHPVPKEVVSSLQAEFRRDPSSMKKKFVLPIRG